jgi:2-polyprenyl-3-methyl-5-hydroxy-6-metoxy-1,4-benzoquinol methylase
MSTPSVTDLYKGVADDRERIFGRSFYGDFLNWGYWKWNTEDHVAACENLVELVLAMAPRSGPSVLEAGCGVGGVSRRLARHYEQVTGINVMPDQLEKCRQLVPTAAFHQMDATALTFDTESFHDVVSIEAAMHFDTRERFFGESFRVLRPGGHLLFADIIAAPQVSRSNVTSVEDYARALEAAGFAEARVIDVTRDTAGAHADYCLWYLRDRLERGAIDQRRFDQAAVGIVARLAATKHYVVGSARKPPDGRPPWREAPHAGTYLSLLLTATAGL